MRKAISILMILTALFFVATAVTGIYAFTGESAVLDEQGDGLDMKEFDYSWTTAICGENGNPSACRDYEIVCLDGEAIRLDPVSGMVIFPDDWKDRRSGEDREFCRG